MWPFDRRLKKDEKVWADRRFFPACEYKGPDRRNGLERRLENVRKTDWMTHRKGQEW